MEPWVELAFAFYFENPKEKGDDFSSRPHFCPLSDKAKHRLHPKALPWCPTVARHSLTVQPGLSFVSWLATLPSYMARTPARVSKPTLLCVSWGHGLVTLGTARLGAG